MSDDSAGSGRDAVHILIMCTANQCRSPMAERLMRAELARRAITARVSSAGMLEGGAPATSGAVKALQRVGIDLDDHVSRQIDGYMVDDADLVITMERRHLGVVRELSHGSARRSFTLKELARIAPGIGPQPDFRSWVAAADASRPNPAALEVAPDDDVADPMGRSRRAYRRTAADLAEMITTVTRSAFPV